MAFLRQLGRGNRSNEASAAKATARRAQTLAFPSLASRSAASAIANSFSICSNLTPCIMDNLRYQVADKMGQCAFKILVQQLAKCMCGAVPVQDFAGSVVEHRLHLLDVLS